MAKLIQPSNAPCGAEIGCVTSASGEAQHRIPPCKRRLFTKWKPATIGDVKYYAQCLLCVINRRAMICEFRNNRVETRSYEVVAPVPVQSLLTVTVEGEFEPRSR